MYDADLKREIARLRIEEGYSVKKLADQFNVSLGTVSRVTKEYRDKGFPALTQEQLKDKTKEIEKLQSENERLQAKVVRLEVENQTLREVLKMFSPQSVVPDES